MAVRSATINVMTAAALKAARGLIRDFGEVEQLQVSVKGPGDFVTTADLRAERLLRTELAKARPGYAMLMEEGGAEANHRPVCVHPDVDEGAHRSDRSQRGQSDRHQARQD